MRIILMGPPGAGKGTQAVLVSKLLHVPHISTGEIFRANIAEGTSLGVEAQRYMDAGEYVPDNITNAMVRDRLSQDDTKPGFLLDGYPRTLDQVAELDSMLSLAGTKIDKVVELTVNVDEVVGRLTQRSEEQGRVDDSGDVIRRRLEVYADQTAPLIALYRDRGLLAQVNGIGEVEQVTDRIREAVGLS